MSGFATTASAAVRVVMATAAAGVADLRFVEKLVNVDVLHLKAA